MSDLPLDTGMQRQIAIAVKMLAAGGVAAIPTDTLYGLAANAFDEPAVQKVYELKRAAGRHGFAAAAVGCRGC